jgi:hypothetical protein
VYTIKIACFFAILFVPVSLAVAEEADTRTAIQLSSQHRTRVLTEMRQFLSGLQQMTDALSREDMETVTREAHTLGTAMSHQMPADLKEALPQGFRKLGHSVHSGFDQIALDAQALGDSKHVLSQLGDILSRCVSCHSMYKIHVINN